MKIFILIVMIGVGYLAFNYNWLMSIPMGFVIISYMKLFIVLESVNIDSNNKSKTTEQQKNNPNSKEHYKSKNGNYGANNNKYNYIKKGKDYEEFVGAYFESMNYSVVYNGIINGKGDNGIDLICSNSSELILIQCKNWNPKNKHKITHLELKAFIGSCTEYVNKHKFFDRKLKLKYITSGYILDGSGKKFLEESKILEYKVYPF